MKRVLVTGGTGFVGTHLVSFLMDRGYRVRLALRKPMPLHPHLEAVVVGEIGPDTDWSAALQDVDFVVHAAARVHIMRDRSENPDLENLRVNAEGTRRLATAAARRHVERFVFISSVKVMGEDSGDRPWREDDPAEPTDPYGMSKLRAERYLSEIDGDSDLPFVILRPPLVYGPGVGGNFLSLMRLAASPIPLPLAAARNQRSLVYVGNLVDAITLGLEHAGLVGGAYFVTDGAPVSTADLVREMRGHLNRRSGLFSVPPTVLRSVARITNRVAMVDRLFGNLEIDDTRFASTVDWHRPWSFKEGLGATMEWFRQKRP